MTVSVLDARAFLALHRLAVVGASDDPKKFGNTIYKELKAHGHDVVPVNPGSPTIDGDATYAKVSDITPPVDGVVVMVNARAARDVIDDIGEAGVKDVWLFKGLGSEGAVSDDVLVRCEANDMRIVAGACPLMFLEPVGWFHKVHRAFRRLNHGVSEAA